jgi:hypothetical protein
MSDAEVRLAIAIELEYILPKGWSLSESASGFLVVGPDAPEFRSRVWRIAEFIAYEAFLSIERTQEEPREYTIVSRSKGDLKFRVVIRAEQRPNVAPEVVAVRTKKKRSPHSRRA